MRALTLEFGGESAGIPGQVPVVEYKLVNSMSQSEMSMHYRETLLNSCQVPVVLSMGQVPVVEYKPVNSLSNLFNTNLLTRCMSMEWVQGCDFPFNGPLPTQTQKSYLGNHSGSGKPVCVCVCAPPLVFWVRRQPLAAAADARTTSSNASQSHG